MEYNRQMNITNVHYTIMLQRNTLLCVANAQEQKDVLLQTVKYFSAVSVFLARGVEMDIYAMSVF